jgi:TfoX-like protein
MAYDERLAGRVRGALDGQCEFVEKKMFGGIAFMVDGHMCCGVVGKDLMVRVGPDRFQQALARPHARVMDFTGRPSRGMVYVGTGGTRTASAVEAWVGRGLSFVRSLPAKEARRRR